jgi:hypothetical protein
MSLAWLRKRSAGIVWEGETCECKLYVLAGGARVGGSGQGSDVSLVGRLACGSSREDGAATQTKASTRLGLSAIRNCCV